VIFLLCVVEVGYLVILETVLTTENATSQNLVIATVVAANKEGYQWY
jgi:hypothetical protein